MDYYDLNPHFRFQKMSIGLFGHIHRPDDRTSHYLTSPFLLLEQRKKNSASTRWILAARSEPAMHDVPIARLQNVIMDPNSEYRIGVGSLSTDGGRYALIVDPAVEGFEFEVEDLDLGETPNHVKHSLSVAYVVPDRQSQHGERIYAGTESGYILTSGDDAKTWRQIYPPAGQSPLHGTVFGLFVDSKGIIYASPWTAADQVLKKNLHGFVMESRDGGLTWTKAFSLEWPTGVAWRIAEDSHGNVFIGEYSSKIVEEGAPRYAGNVWRRKNHGNNSEVFEVVFANPRIEPDTLLNHTHYVGVDPYTDDVYAAIGDGGVGRFIRSRRQGDPGTWETLERGVNSQYTAVTFTQRFLFLGMDTDRQFKKIVRWDKNENFVAGNEPFWTTTGIDFYPASPIPWADKGNWFWAHHVDEKALVFAYMPYGDVMENGQLQPPRIYAGTNDGAKWWRLITFPPNPIRNVPRWGENGPKFSSNISPSGWIYAMRGTVSDKIHRGFRFRLKPGAASGIFERNWENMN